MFADLHTHILYDIDDGPKDLEESLTLVKAAMDDGIDRIVATPHFYASRHGLEERVHHLRQRMEQLNISLNENDISVTVLPGFEVRYFEGISRSDSISELTLNNSNIILLELGSIALTDHVINDILELGYNGYTVLLAHIERYAKMPGFKRIKELIKNKRVLAQVNASSFLGGPFFRPACRLLKEGLVSVLSSDMHSVDLRPPEMTQAYKVIEKKVGIAKKKLIINNTAALFEIIGG